ncbi:hypothetical protein C8J57DRAFT_1713582 [Mycena rebaudengoi]|nr:hypothetical protein C8J57DRAFT_1713582 [Mycena rebaudengoi]
MFPALLALSGTSTPPHLTGAEITWKLTDPPDGRPPLFALAAHRACMCTRPPTAIRSAGRTNLRQRAKRKSRTHACRTYTV